MKWNAMHVALISAMCVLDIMILIIRVIFDKYKCIHFTEKKWGGRYPTCINYNKLELKLNLKYLLWYTFDLWDWYWNELDRCMLCNVYIEQLRLRLNHFGIWSYRSFSLPHFIIKSRNDINKFTLRTWNIKYWRKKNMYFYLR